jgi:hypothetical protein
MKPRQKSPLFVESFAQTFEILDRSWCLAGLSPAPETALAVRSKPPIEARPALLLEPVHNLHPVFQRQRTIELLPVLEFVPGPAAKSAAAKSIIDLKPEDCWSADVCEAPCPPDPPEDIVTALVPTDATPRLIPDWAPALFLAAALVVGLLALVYVIFHAGSRTMTGASIVSHSARSIAATAR